MALVNGYKIEQSGDIKFPVTTLVGILDNRKLSTASDVDNSANRIAQGGVIKRAYVPHDVSPLVKVTDTAPDISNYAAGDIYYNTTDKLLYRATLNSETNQLYWYTGANRADEPKSDRLFVDISTGKMYFWYPVLDAQGNPTTDQQGNIVNALQQVGGDSGGSSLSGLTAVDV